MTASNRRRWRPDATDEELAADIEAARAEDEIDGVLATAPEITSKQAAVIGRLLFGTGATASRRTGSPWIFVDCEARGISPVSGTLTEFGAVYFDTRDTFHGQLFESVPDPVNPAVPLIGARIATDMQVAGDFAAWLRGHLGSHQPVFISDNPAYDWMWIAGLFDRAELANPFGHSGRRIGDFWAGLNQDWRNTQGWKRLRKTAHDHNPVHDALGNAEAFAEILHRVETGRFQPRSTKKEEP